MHADDEEGDRQSEIADDVGERTGSIVVDRIAGLVQRGDVALSRTIDGVPGQRGDSGNKGHVERAREHRLPRRRPEPGGHVEAPRHQHDSCGHHRDKPTGDDEEKRSSGRLGGLRRSQRWLLLPVCREGRRLGGIKPEAEAAEKHEDYDGHQHATGNERRPIRQIDGPGEVLEYHPADEHPGCGRGDNLPRQQPLHPAVARSTKRRDQSLKLPSDAKDGGDDQERDREGQQVREKGMHGRRQPESQSRCQDGVTVDGKPAEHADPPAHSLRLLGAQRHQPGTRLMRGEKGAC
jgi:hypothetical protein